MKRFALILTLTLVVLPIFVFAQPKSYIPLVPIPGFTGSATAPVDLGGYLGALYKILIGVTILLAVIVITISGVQNMTSESPFNKSEAKRRIGEAIGGIVLATVSYLILATINPALVRFDFLRNTTVTPNNTSSQSTGQVTDHTLSQEPEVVGIFCFETPTNPNSPQSTPVVCRNTFTECETLRNEFISQLGANSVLTGCVLK